MPCMILLYAGHFYGEIIDYKFYTTRREAREAMLARRGIKVKPILDW